MVTVCKFAPATMEVTRLDTLRDEVWERMEMAEDTGKSVEEKLGWYGHCQRIGNDRFPRSVLGWEQTGRRARGRCLPGRLVRSSDVDRYWKNQTVTLWAASPIRKYGPTNFTNTKTYNTMKNATPFIGRNTVQEEILLQDTHIDTTEFCMIHSHSHAPRGTWACTHIENYHTPREHYLLKCYIKALKWHFGEDCTKGLAASELQGVWSRNNDSFVGYTTCWRYLFIEPPKALVVLILCLLCSSRCFSSIGT